MMSPRCSVEQPTKPRTTIIANAKRIVAIECKPNPTAFNQHLDFEATFCGLQRKAFTLDQQSLAVTNARFASLHGLPVVPYAFSTTPVPLRKSRARHERHPHKTARAARFRLALDVFAPASGLHSFRFARYAIRSSRHLQTEAILAFCSIHIKMSSVQPAKLETHDDLLAQAEHYANYSMRNMEDCRPRSFW